MAETERVRRSRRRKAVQASVVQVAASAATVAPVATRMNAALAQLGGFFAERDDVLRCMMIALLTGMNYLLVGPRGTAKTAMAIALMRHVEGTRHFTTLLGSFSTLNDLVGRLDLAALQRGEERRKTEGKMLDCDTAFLDEALKGSDGVLNSMLGLLSENRDFEGNRIDLWSAGSATNWPEVDRRNDRISALYDRFHIKVPVNAVSSREARVKVLRSARETYQPAQGSTWTMNELRTAAAEVKAVKIAEEIEELLCSVQERCLKENIDVSDRKLGQWQKALRASAWLAGRDSVSIEDFDIVAYMAWDNREDIDKARSIVGSCDMELVQALIKRVDKTRGDYMAARNEGLNAVKAGVVLDDMIATATYVTDAIKRYRLKPESKKDIGRAVQAMHKDFEALYAKYQPALAESEEEG